MLALRVVGPLTMILACGCAAGPSPVLDVDGLVVDPFRPAGAKAAVVIFVTTQCAIANAMAPSVRRLADRYEPLGVRFTIVHVDPDLNVTGAKQHAAAYSLPGRIVIDREHRLVTQAGATMTPEAVVYDASGAIAYRGRINNLYVGLGQRRDQITRHDLAESLDALLAGRPVANPHVPVVGCDMIVLPGDASPSRR